MRSAAFRLVQEIESKRPLLAPDMPMSDIVKEILDTYKAPWAMGDVASAQPPVVVLIFLGKTPGVFPHLRELTLGTIGYLRVSDLEMTG